MAEIDDEVSESNNCPFSDVVIAGTYHKPGFTFTCTKANGICRSFAGMQAPELNIDPDYRNCEIYKRFKNDEQER